MSDSVEPKGNGNNAGNNVPKMAGLNGGMLNAGGTPGNKGGTGRPPNALRQLARDLYGEYLEPSTRKIMDSDNPMDNRTKVQILDHYAKFGLGEPKILVEEDLMQAVMDVAFKMLEPNLATEFIEALDARLKEIG